jgi:hypothetical protein
MRTLLALVCGFLLAAGTAAGQAPFRMTAALVNAAKPVIVSVTFSDPLAATGPHTEPSDVHLTGAPGITAKSVVLSVLPMGENSVNPAVTVVLSAPLPPGDVQICFNRVSYVRADKVVTTTADVCAPISADIAGAKAAALKELSDTPVPPDEKTLNASAFVTTASDNSEGGADLAFNPKLSDPNASVFFRLKKATAEKGDARHLEIGAAYRVGIPWNRAQLRKMREATDLVVLNDLLLERQQSLIAGSVVNLAMKLEGEPTAFDATNGVGDAHYEILSMTRRLAGRQGFWRGYVIPAGAEIGRKLGVDATGAASTDHEWIARYKAGGGFTVFYQAASPRIPLSRLDFEVDGIWRYLAVDELNFDVGTKKIDRTTDGGHGYLQVAMKAFFAETASGRFGIRASYNRGSLPPVFAAVRSFEFGFVIESNDKD